MPNGRTYTYDANGNRTGSYKQLKSGKTIRYDANGNKTGSFKRF